MPSSGVRRTALSLVAFLATCGVAGMVVSKRVGAQSADTDAAFRDSLKSFANVYQTVAENYAEPLDGDKPDKAIYDGAIPSMLHVLDPHSSFQDPKAFAKLREDQRGKYYGVGMLIQAQLGGGVQKIVVVSPFEGTPSYKAGIRPGDTIIAVDGKSTTNLSSEEVASMLKGNKGTHVKITVTREGAQSPLSFDLVRDEIPHNSVDLAYELRPGIGYIHITQFQETTGREVVDAVDKMGDLKGLVLDLRGNPGGVLNEAVTVCDKFLEKGQVIVSQRGRAYPEQVYRAMHGNAGKTYPIVVLTNRGTASAAEIVSGALQDHDRALILGETTFGKGLVQTIFTLSDNTGLLLTTYHYYTPSGRLIQRNYNGVSLYDYYYNHEKPEPAKDREVKLTDTGRTEYGGGGITPDVAFDPPKNTHVQDVLLAHYAFFDYSKRYMAAHTVTRDFQVTDAVLADFKQMLTEKGISYNEAELQPVMDWVKTSIKSELFTAQFGQAEGLKVRENNDPMVLKALTVMPQAETLEQAAIRADADKHAAKANIPSTM
jgi:carboxyl-terminal processing protease